MDPRKRARIEGPEGSRGMEDERPAKQRWSPTRLQVVITNGGDRIRFWNGEPSKVWACLATARAGSVKSLVVEKCSGPEALLSKRVRDSALASLRDVADVTVRGRGCLRFLCGLGIATPLNALRRLTLIDVDHADLDTCLDNFVVVLATSARNVEHIELLRVRDSVASVLSERILTARAIWQDDFARKIDILSRYGVS